MIFYLKNGALYFVRACIRSLAKCCWADKVGFVILDFSLHQSTCRSYALKPNDLPQCGQISFILIVPIVRFDDLPISGVSVLTESNFGDIRCVRLPFFASESCILAMLEKLEV